MPRILAGLSCLVALALSPDAGAAQDPAKVVPATPAAVVNAPAPPQASAAATAVVQSPPAAPAHADVGSSAPASPITALPAAARTGLPPMRFVSSLAEDEMLAALKSNPAFAALDKELYGSPLVLRVTHTVRPTAGGTAAGLLSAMLSGGTLGILPVVSSERLVVRYEVLLNGNVLASQSFENTSTRAINIWAAGQDKYAGLGKAAFEWVKGTAADASARLAVDPEIARTREEIEYYFPQTP